MSLARKARTFAQLPFRDQVSVAHVAIVALAAEAGLRLTKPPRLARRFGLTVGRDAAPPAPKRLPPLSDGETRALRAASMIFGTVMSERACLRYSLVAGRILRRRRPVLRFAATRRDGDVHAHAWIEVEGARIDWADATAFTPMKGAP